MSDCEKKRCHVCEKKQRHVHEFLGSTRLAELEDDPHNHRFAGVSGPAIPGPCGHVHEIKTNTDFFDHFHVICVITGPPIPVGKDRHVHFVKAITSCNDGHVHELIFATLIEAPIFEGHKK